MGLFRPGKSNAPIPAHPYRDSALVFAGMCVFLVVAATLTGGSLVRALIAAAAFFVLATAWSWWGYRRRIRERDAALAAEAAATSTARNGATSSTNGNGNGRRRTGK
jgi:hypothetical protein